ncbi:macrophage mannose receptor 1-like [Pagrus major]|uniref:macrophage mannose receptor 1-like n=1 Tax=Pagrus major TaxID=143350 RepID=UPI003CC8DDCE
MKITCAAIVLLIQTVQCLASDDSPFQLSNKDTGYCLVKTNSDCNDIRWTTGDRILVPQRNKCLGAQGKSVGSEISLYDCDESSELQKWECTNETVLALKDQELYIELTADNTAVLSKTVGPNNNLTITGTSSGACTRTYRELYAIGGNAAGMPCMFPFQYHDQWYSDCTRVDSSEKNLWCAVETKFQTERWGYCPVTSKGGWKIHPTTGAYYQLNTQSALTWRQAETSCKQQGASLLSITDPHEQAYVTALLGTAGTKLWTGLILDPEHGWKWYDGRPYRYLKWDAGHPLPDPGHNCAVFEPTVHYSWQSSPCSKKLGYICYSKAAEQLPTQAVGGFCSTPWIPYNGHCFRLDRTQKTWSDAQRECRNRGGDLVSIHNVEEQGFVISQLGYESTDELWIGLNDRKTERLFDWIDHSTVSFTSWEFGKPATSTEIKDCVLIRGENGNWADHVCEEKHGFICMKMSASKSTGDEVVQNEGCKTGWRRYGSYCYFIATDTLTFSGARSACRRSGSYLADVSNGVDNAFLVSLVGMKPRQHFWLGLSNSRNGGRFVWTNKDTVRYTHWNAEMPGRQQGCVAMITGHYAGLWDVLPCSNEEKYICKHLAEGAALTPTPPLATLECPFGWTRMKSSNNCLKIFSERSSFGRTWFEARDFCRTIGGDLASFHSHDDLTVLKESHIYNFWIGLRAPDPVTGYVWSDGSPVQFQHWYQGEPDNKNHVESCVVLNLFRIDSGGSWSDVHCEQSHQWLCQIPSGIHPKPTPGPVVPDYNVTSDMWLEWNGNQYYFGKSQVSMEEARRSCQNMHGDLVTINSEAESIFIWKQISRSYSISWIGLTVDLDRTYGWMDGSPVVFQRWEEYQPRFENNDENCVGMPPTGFWHNYNCGNDRNYICKRNGTPPANATVAPTVSPKGGCPQNWKKFESRCYNIVNNQNVTWVEARTQCQNMGGNLASIPSQRVQVFLTAAMIEAPTTDLWIGMNNRNERRYYWTDGKPVRYNNWGFAGLNHHQAYERHRYAYEKKECAWMTTDPSIVVGRWSKRSCNETAGFVCHRNVDSSFPDTPEPTTYTNYVRVLNDSIKVVTLPMTWYEAKAHCQGDGAQLASLRNEWSQAYVELMLLNVRGPLWIGLNSAETGGYFRFIGGWRITTSNWDSREPRMDQSCVYVNEDGKWRTADCNRKMKSFCMKTTDVPPTQSSVFPGFCPDDQNIFGQRFSWLPFRGYCYLFLKRRFDWPSASTECAAEGAALASIEDPDEQEFINSNIQIFQDSEQAFWIGLFKTRRDMWLWLDKTAMDYSNWDSRYPSGGRYGAIRARDGKWTASMGGHKGYICKIPKVLRQAPTTAVSPQVDPSTHGHIILTVGLVLSAIIIVIGIALILFKKSGRRFPIPKKFTTFDNPLFFSNERSRSNVVDKNKLVVNEMEENPAPAATV